MISPEVGRRWQAKPSYVYLELGRPFLGVVPELFQSEYLRYDHTLPTLQRSWCAFGIDSSEGHYSMW
jgi:hypothetical protein